MTIRVREEIEAPQVPIAAGALQGLGSFLNLQQKKEEQKRSDFISVLPALASMGQLEPGREGEPGAFEMGGQWMKIIPKPKTEDDRLARLRGDKIQQEMSDDYQNKQAKDTWESENGFLKEDKKKQASRTQAYAAIDKRYPPKALAAEPAGAPVAGAPKQYVATDKNGSQKLINEEQVAMNAGDPNITIEPYTGQTIKKKQGWFGNAVDSTMGYFKDEQGDFDIGKAGQLAPLAALGMKGALSAAPLAIQGVSKFLGPAGWIGAGANLGLNLMSDNIQGQTEADNARIIAEMNQPVRPISPSMAQYSRGTAQYGPTPTQDQLMTGLLSRYANNPEMLRMLMAGQGQGQQASLF